MAKTMAVLDVSEVVNIIWCEDDTPDADNMVSTNGKPVQFGDHYEDGKFYRDGSEVLSDVDVMIEALRILGVDV